MMSPQDFMLRAIALAENNSKAGGSPFGTVIVHKGKIIAEATNRVHVSHDPSDHAEIAAIRIACQTLGRANLEDCELYAIAHPCPMCMVCMMFARIGRVYFSVGLDMKDNALSRLPRSDSILEELAKPFELGATPMQHLTECSDEGVRVLRAWNDKVL